MLFEEWMKKFVDTWGILGFAILCLCILISAVGFVVWCVITNGLTLVIPVVLLGYMSFKIRNNKNG
jgi:hypothetical protein